MAYEDWEPALQGYFYDDVPGTRFLDDFEERHAQELFELGFTHHASEYEAWGLTEDDVHGFRQEFFEYMGIDESTFDWEGWREAMGYE